MTPTMVCVFAAVLGAAIGSFLNVVIYRLPRQCLSIVRPGSRCVKCRHPLAWYENLPVLSWIALRGRCAHCGARISVQYPLVELAVALLFAAAAYRFVLADGRAVPAEWEPWARGAIFAAFGAMLIAAAGVDLALSVIPDELSLGGALVAPALSFAVPALHAGNFEADWFGDPHVGALLSSLYGLLLGAGLLVLLGSAGRAYYKEEAMGWGDIKLLAFIGAMLGWAGVLLALLVAALSGAVYGLGRELLRRVRGRARGSVAEPAPSDSRGASGSFSARGTERARITFGLHLALGSLAALFFRAEISHFLFETYPRLILGAAEAR